jgi:hypothetical protein
MVGAHCCLVDAGSRSTFGGGKISRDLEGSFFVRTIGKSCKSLSLSEEMAHGGSRRVGARTIHVVDLVLKYDLPRI